MSLKGEYVSMMAIKVRQLFVLFCFTLLLCEMHIRIIRMVVVILKDDEKVK